MQILGKLLRGSAVDILAIVRDDITKQPIDLDANPTAEVRDPNNRLVNTELADDIVKEGLGRYIYQHQSSETDTLGFYTVTFIGSVGTRTEKAMARFEVVAR